MAVTNCLVACLESFKAPESVTGCADVFSDFASFCNNPAFRDSVPRSIQDAWRARRHSINAAAQSRRIFIFKAGLNWKPALQTIRRNHRLAQMPCWVAIDLGVPYPPPGHWVAENVAILDLWKDYLETRKMCDARTPSHPIHQLDLNALMHDIPPDQGAIFKDDGAANAFSPASLCLLHLLDELIGIVIRNFCHDPKLVAFVNKVIQLCIEVKRNVRVSDYLQLVGQKGSQISRKTTLAR